MAATRETPATGRRSFVRAAVLGSLLALPVDLAIVLGPDVTLVKDSGVLGGFYDLQGRAFLDGHLDVDPGLAAIEGFENDGRTYLYFGPVPALMRLPVLLVTHGLDGRLTQLSLVLGLLVLLAAGAWLHWAVRSVVRPAAAVDRREAAVIALLQLALGAGAIPLYLLSRPVVYHEAELWGASFAVAALAATIAIVREPALRHFAVACVFATLAINTRVSVGLGPVAALAILTVTCAVRLALRRGGPGDRRTLAALALATVIPLAVSAAINVVKFDRPFGIPLERQAASRLDPQRRAALAANPDGLFGAKFVPTTLVQALRPDAIGTARAFPFVATPARPAHVFGDVRFDTVERSLSAFTSMPLFCVLTIAGVVLLLRRRRHLVLLGVLAGSAAGFAVTLTIAYVTTRYLADLLPCLLLGAAIGIQALIAATVRLSGLAIGGIAALTAAGLVVNGSVGLLSQRLTTGDPRPSDRADFVRAQDDVDRLLGRRPTGISSGPRLPPAGDGRAGDLFNLDGCAGLYVRGLQGEWLPVERTAGSGAHRLQVRFPATAVAGTEPLLVLGTGARRVAVVTEDGDAGRTFAVRVGGRTVATSPPVPGLRGRAVPMRVSFDPYLGRTYVNVRVAGRSVGVATAPYDRRAPRWLGIEPGGPRPRRFSGRVRAAPTPAPLCRRLERRAGRQA